MARLDRQTFEVLSERAGFKMDVLEKVYRLTELLKEIVGTRIENELVLKRGTAINFLHFHLPSLSVDIDMDYVGSVEKEQMDQDREVIDDILKKVFRVLEYRSKERKSYALQKYNLFYENSAENRDRIELEINYLKRATILSPIKRKFEHPFDVGEFQVLSLKIEDLFGRKLTALVQRGATRDLYDIYRLLTSDLTFDREAMRKCFLFSLCLNGDPREVDSTSLEGITTRDIRRSLLPMLRKGESVDLDEMQQEVKPLVKEFLAYRDNEMEFIERMFEEKHYELELLFGDVDFNNELPNHPGIEWRLRNI